MNLILLIKNRLSMIFSQFKAFDGKIILSYLDSLEHIVYIYFNLFKLVKIELKRFKLVSER